MVKNLPAMQKKQEMQAQSLGWEDSLEEGMITLEDRGPWWATLHGVAKSRT